IALQSEALCEMFLDKPDNVISLLKNQKWYSFLPSVGQMLSQSYQMLGETKEAKFTLQDSILDSILTIFYDITAYLSICNDDVDHFDEICRRAINLGETFNIKQLFPVAILSFFLTAAEGYLTIGNMDKALIMLESYSEVATDDIFPLTTRGDKFFTLIDELKDKQLDELSFKMTELSRDTQSIKQDIVDSVIQNPIFTTLANDQRYKVVTKKLEVLLHDISL
ncbi:MAG: hypothetical protein ACK5LC_17485, partial [Coprobacillaceae bacterium]